MRASSACSQSRRNAFSFHLLLQAPSSNFFKFLIVYRAAVVGVYKTKVPPLAALVHIGHAGTGKFQEHLHQRIDDAEIELFYDAAFENFSRTAGAYRAALPQNLLLPFRRLHSAWSSWSALCFAQGFLQVFLQPVYIRFVMRALHRVRTGQRLVNKIFIICIRRTVSFLNPVSVSASVQRFPATRPAGR
jgi:hypothetical protein